MNKIIICSLLLLALLPFSFCFMDGDYKGVDETTIDAKSKSPEEIDNKEDPPTGIDETKIDANSGSPEEIDQDQEFQDFDMMTEVEINEILGYTGEEALVEDGVDKRAPNANTRLWQKVNGLLHIPYEIDSSLESHRARLENFIRIMNNAIRCNPNTWKPKTSNDSHWVLFQTSTGCSSFIGNVGFSISPQPINLASLCITANDGTVLHEMLHAMGFYHEHSRNDRDTFVRINQENIQAGRENNFVKETTINEDSKTTQYDYSSVMHYSRTAFSKNGLDTITPIDENGTERNDVTIGQRNGLSAIDIQEMNKVYKCSAITTSRAETSTSPTTSTRSMTTTANPTTTTSTTTTSPTTTTSTTTTSPTTTTSTTTTSPTTTTSTTTTSPTTTTSTTTTSPTTTTTMTTAKPTTTSTTTTASPTTMTRPVATSSPTTMTTARPATTVSPRAREVFSCGFGTESCDLNNPHVNVTMYRFQKSPVYCMDYHRKCSKLANLNFCQNRYFGHIMRRLCKKSCRMCPYISTRKTGYVFMRVRPQDCTQQQIQSRSRNSYCFKIDYQRTNYLAPRFKYFSYALFRTGPRYTFNFSHRRLIPYRRGAKQTLRKTVKMSCTDFYNYIYIYIARQRRTRGELKFFNVSLKEGKC